MKNEGVDKTFFLTFELLLIAFNEKYIENQVLTVIVGKINVFAIKPCTKISQGNYFLTDIFDVFE